MRTDKIIGLTLSLLIMGFFLIPLGQKKDIYIRKSIDIQNDPVSIYFQISEIEAWKGWFPLSNEDKINIYQIDATKNTKAILVWKWAESKSGNFKITSKTPYQSVHFNLVFQHFGSLQGEFLIKPDKNFTTLQLSCEITSLSYPIGRWKGLFIPLITSKYLEKSLENINKEVMN